MPWLITDPAPGHTPALRRIYYQARQMAFPWMDPAHFSLLDFDQITKGERLLVALGPRQEPVGFITWWPPDSFIHSLFVDPLFTGQGVGRMLLAACLQQLGRPATLKCKTRNQRALGFYYAEGWRVLEEAENELGAYQLLVFTG